MKNIKKLGYLRKIEAPALIGLSCTFKFVKTY
jgi:hypothetical protein